MTDHTAIRRSVEPYKRGFVVMALGMLVIVSTFVWWLVLRPDDTARIANCRGKITGHVTHEQIIYQADEGELVGALADPTRRPEVPGLAKDLAEQGRRMIAAQNTRDDFEAHPSTSCPDVP